MNEVFEFHAPLLSNSTRERATPLVRWPLCDDRSTGGGQANTGTSESTRRLAIVQLIASRAVGRARKRPIATPKAPHSITEIKQPVDSTRANTALSQTTSPPMVLNAASALSVDTQALGLSQVSRIPSKKPIGLARVGLRPAASARAMRQAR